MSKFEVLSHWCKIMNRYDRQERIAGWNQEQLSDASVLVLGRGWTGTFLVWALSSMGVGNILWVGRSRRSTQRMGRWLMSPNFLPDSSRYLYPFAIEYQTDLDWLLQSTTVKVLVHCTDDPIEQATSRHLARENRIPWLGGTTARGGWFGQGVLPRRSRKQSEEPSTALAVAALLADGVREILCPLDEGILPPEGSLGMEWQNNAAPPGPQQREGPRVVLVGVGGIGVYVATALAAHGFALHLVDHDHVEESNLNRQGLFRAADARKGVAKSRAARRALHRLFPAVALTSEVRRVEEDYRDTLHRLSPRPCALLSAVDNARARLLLQMLGQVSQLPVIQGGTDTFAADCFTQLSGGPTLDQQMHGALSEAQDREVPRVRPGGCAGDPSYVVPGMMAGALMAHRLLHVVNKSPETSGSLPPMRWRSGSLPAQQRRLSDAFSFRELINWTS